MRLMRGGWAIRIAGASALGFALAACSGTLPGVEDRSPAPKIEMGGRWLLAATNAPACGMTFTVAADAQSGDIRPEGGCPGDFFTSRQWGFAGGELVINNHNGEPLAQLRFVGGHFEGKSTSGLQITLARSLLPSN
jgi:Protease inhibitor Inh